MKRHTAASILHPEALVQLFVQVYDIIQYICENKNTLGHNGKFAIAHAAIILPRLNEGKFLMLNLPYRKQMT